MTWKFEIWDEKRIEYVVSEEFECVEGLSGVHLIERPELTEHLVKAQAVSKLSIHTHTWGARLLGERRSKGSRLLRQPADTLEHLYWAHVCYTEWQLWWHRGCVRCALRHQSHEDVPRYTQLERAVQLHLAPAFRFLLVQVFLKNPRKK